MRRVENPPGGVQSDATLRQVRPMARRYLLISDWLGTPLAIVPVLAENRSSL